jgi:hypothetical protein
MFVCLALVGFTFGMIRSIWKMMKNVPGSSVSGILKKFGKVPGKLMALAVVVFILWLIRTSIAGAQEPIITSFNMYAKKWADCQTIIAHTRAWAQQVFCCCCCVNRCYRASHENIHHPLIPPLPHPHRNYLLTHRMVVCWTNVTRFQMLEHPCGLPVC